MSILRQSNIQTFQNPARSPSPSSKTRKQTRSAKIPKRARKGREIGQKGSETVEIRVVVPLLRAYVRMRALQLCKEQGMSTPQRVVTWVHEPGRWCLSRPRVLSVSKREGCAFQAAGHAVQARHASHLTSRPCVLAGNTPRAVVPLFCTRQTRHGWLVDCVGRGRLPSKDRKRRIGEVLCAGFPRTHQDCQSSVSFPLQLGSKVLCQQGTRPFAQAPPTLGWHEMV